MVKEVNVNGVIFGQVHRAQLDVLRIRETGNSTFCTGLSVCTCRKDGVLVGGEGETKGRQDLVLGDFVCNLTSPFEGKCSDDRV